MCHLSAGGRLRRAGPTATRTRHLNLPGAQCRALIGITQWPSSIYGALIFTPSFCHRVSAQQLLATLSHGSCAPCACVQLHCLPQHAQRDMSRGCRAARDRRRLLTADEHARRLRPCRMMLRHHMLTRWCRSWRAKNGACSAGMCDFLCSYPHAGVALLCIRM